MENLTDNNQASRKNRKQKYTGFYDSNNCLINKGDIVTITDSGALYDQLGDSYFDAETPKNNTGIVIELAKKYVVNIPKEFNYIVVVRLFDSVETGFNAYEVTLKTH